MFFLQLCLCYVVVDMFVMVVYCFVVNMLIEIFFFGMSFEQLFFFRLVVIFVNVLIVWLYGVYCDLIMCVVCKVSLVGWVKNLVDVLVYVIFQLFVYIIILLIVGVGWYQIVVVVSLNIVVLMLMGVVYGYFLDYCCCLFKVSSYYQVKV